MAKTNSGRFFSMAVSVAVIASSAGLASGPALAQTTTPSPAASSATAAQAAPAGTAATPARRRPRRRYAVRPAVQMPAPTQQTVGLSPEQRRRDAQILAVQQAQSSETARQQAIVTGKVIKDRQAQQDEPRIQDAPGPGSQPLPGNPATTATQQSDPSSIQDAPGPAQTLPQTPAPAAPAPASTPAPQL